MIGPFNSDYYLVNGMVLESRKRREHLSEEDLQKNKALVESLTRGHSPVNGNPEQVSYGEICWQYIYRNYFSSCDCDVYVLRTRHRQKLSFAYLVYKYIATFALYFDNRFQH